jgi:hypothetical protein
VEQGAYHGDVKKQIVLPMILMLVFAASRWPGLLPANWAAAYAIMFCAGLYFPSRLAWTAPFATLLVSDILISLFAYPSMGMKAMDYIWMMAPNYIAYAAILLLGRFFKARQSWLKLTCGGLLGALIFYLVTNTAAWMTLSYPKNLMGWIQALTTGLPGFPPTIEFLRSTLLSGGLFTGLFVGAVKLLEASESAEEKREPAKEAESEEEPEPEESKA